MRNAHGQQAIDRGRCCGKNENALFMAKSGCGKAARRLTARRLFKQNA
jgi:hypothetical protein